MLFRLSLCLALAAVASAQSLPKVRVPGNVPGAGRVNSLPQTPKQAANEAKRAEVQELMGEALSTDDPEEQAEIYTKILLIDPTNQVAYNGRRDALQKLEEQQAEDEANAAAEQQAVQESLGQEREKRRAFQAAEAAFVADDLETAAREIEIAREIAPTDPEINQLDRMIRDRREQQTRLRWLLISVAVTVVLGALIFFVIRVRQKDPYLEIANGPDRGTKLPFDGDLVRIGAVPEDDQGKNDFVVPDPTRMISRFHCEVHRRGAKYFLIDLGSTNGTFLNNRQLQPGQKVPIKRGSQFRLGDACIIRLGMERR